MSHEQLILPITFRKQDCFDTFVKGDNQHLISHIQSLVSGENSFENASQRLCVIHGLKACGKTHLLLATCEFAHISNKSTQYLDLAKLLHLPPAMLIDMTNKDVVCIDNIHVIDDNFEWQVVLFDIINQFVENERNALLFSSAKHIKSLSFPLPDLETRLNWGTNFTLNGLIDADKYKALKLQMDVLGLKYTNDVIDFIMKRCSRDMSELTNLINTIDKASLLNKRKITIPFVKKTLSI